MIVLCTGCRSGFGKLIALEAARRGHTVYAGFRDLSTQDALMKDAGDLPIVPVQLDVTSEADREAVVAKMLEERGRVDALINNAGIAIGGFVELFEMDEVKKLFEVNTFGAWALMKACLPTMREQKSGIIINITSMAGQMANPGLGIYAGSKFALEGITEALRHEMRPFGVRVVLVEPGPYKTDIFQRNRVMARGVAAPGAYKPYLDKVLAMVEKMTPRMGDATEVSDLVVELLTDPSPKLRYPLGPTVRPRLLLKRLAPFALTERIMKRVIGF